MTKLKEWIRYFEKPDWERTQAIQDYERTLAYVRKDIMGIEKEVSVLMTQLNSIENKLVGFVERMEDSVTRTVGRYAVNATTVYDLEQEIKALKYELELSKKHGYEEVMKLVGGTIDSHLKRIADLEKKLEDEQRKPKQEFTSH